MAGLDHGARLGRPGFGIERGYENSPGLRVRVRNIAERPGSETGPCTGFEQEATQCFRFAPGRWSVSNRAETVVDLDSQREQAARGTFDGDDPACSRRAKKDLGPADVAHQHGTGLHPVALAAKRFEIDPAVVSCQQGDAVHVADFEFLQCAHSGIFAVIDGNGY